MAKAEKGQPGRKPISLGMAPMADPNADFLGSICLTLRLNTLNVLAARGLILPLESGKGSGGEYWN